MVKLKRFIILAPHPDDELIGCYRHLNQRLVDRVYYLFDWQNNDIRKDEAVRCGDFFNFSPVFCSFEQFKHIEIDKTRILLVPNISDVHPHHKMVNIEAKKRPNKKMYYSVDMNVNYTILPKLEAEKKKMLFMTIYPSQLYLLSNDKFHLFESIMKEDISKYIIVKTDFAGIHCWDTAPDDVAYLRSPHRHQFYVKVKIGVKHNEREIEFFTFKKHLDIFIRNVLGFELGGMSCESIATFIMEHFIFQKYPNRSTSIKVYEDNMNGAEVKFQV